MDPSYYQPDNMNFQYHQPDNMAFQYQQADMDPHMQQQLANFDTQQQSVPIPSFREQLVLAQQDSPREWAQYINAYPRPSKAYIYLNDNSNKGDFELIVPLHLANEVLAVVMRNVDPSQAPPYAVLVIEGHMSAGATSVKELESVGMAVQTYDIISAHLRPVNPASGVLETECDGKDTRSRHPGRSRFYGQVHNHSIPFYTRTDDAHVVLLNGYPEDGGKPRQQLRTKASDNENALAMAEFWDSKIRAVLGSDHDGHPALARPQVDYHAVFQMVHASHWRSHDFPSGIAAPRNIRSRLRAIGRWAGVEKNWRHAQRDGEHKQPLPVDPIRIEEVELLRIVGSGKADSSAKWGRVTEEAMKMLQGAYLDFLLNDPIQIHPFWEGSGLYDHLLAQ